MDYIENYLKRLQSQIDNIPDLVHAGIIANADKIIALNIEQIDNHEGSDGKMLKNTDTRFKGTYTQLTEEIAASASPRPEAPKRRGDPYNWVWSGDFMSNFKLEQKGDDFQIYSTGSGSGAKAEFFKGYRNLYGLTKENEQYIFGIVSEYVLNQTMGNLWN